MSKLFMKKNLLLVIILLMISSLISIQSFKKSVAINTGVSTPFTYTDIGKYNLNFFGNTAVSGFDQGIAPGEYKNETGESGILNSTKATYKLGAGYDENPRTLKKAFLMYSVGYNDNFIYTNAKTDTSFYIKSPTGKILRPDPTSSSVHKTFDSNFKQGDYIPDYNDRTAVYVVDITQFLNENGEGEYIGYNLKGDRHGWSGFDQTAYWKVFTIEDCECNPLSQTLLDFSIYEDNKKSMYLTAPGFQVNPDNSNGQYLLSAEGGNAGLVLDRLNMKQYKSNSIVKEENLSEKTRDIDNFFNSTFTRNNVKIQTAFDNSDITMNQYKFEVGINAIELIPTSQLYNGNTSDGFRISGMALNVPIKSLDITTSKTVSNPNPELGEIVEYTLKTKLVNNFNGTNDSGYREILITDKLDTNLEYIPGSIKVNGVSKTDLNVGSSLYRSTYDPISKTNIDIYTQDSTKIGGDHAYFDNSTNTIKVLFDKNALGNDVLLKYDEQEIKFKAKVKKKDITIANNYTTSYGSYVAEDGTDFPTKEPVPQKSNTAYVRATTPNVLAQKELVNRKNEYFVNDEVQYKITVSNTGQMTSKSNEITDKIDSRFDFISATNGTFNKTTNTLIWNIGDIKSGEVFETIIKLKVNDKNVINNSKLGNKVGIKNGDITPPQEKQPDDILIIIPPKIPIKKQNVEQLDIDQKIEYQIEQNIPETTTKYSIIQFADNIDKRLKIESILVFENGIDITDQFTLENIDNTIKITANIEYLNQLNEHNLIVKINAYLFEKLDLTNITNQASFVIGNYETISNEVNAKVIADSIILPETQEETVIQKFEKTGQTYQIITLICLLVLFITALILTIQKRKGAKNVKNY